MSEELPKAKPGAWGCVQAHDLWCTEVEVYMRPIHAWLYEFGDAGDGTSREKELNLANHRWEDYEDTHLCNRGRALVIKRWLNRVQEERKDSNLKSGTPHRISTPLTATFGYDR